MQIGDENVHRVRAVMDEVFGEENSISQIAFRTTTGRGGVGLSEALNYIIWYAKDPSKYKYRSLNTDKSDGQSISSVYGLAKKSDGTIRRLTEEERQKPESLSIGERIFSSDNLTSARPARDNDVREFIWRGKKFSPNKRTYATDITGLQRLSKSDRLLPSGSAGVIIPFCKGRRSRNVTQPWPVAALVLIRPRPYWVGHGCKTTSTSLQSPGPLPSHANSTVTTTRTVPSC